MPTKPADDPSRDYKELVRTGYDHCAEAYAAARSQDDADQLAHLLPLLPDGSSVLDLGCGAGIPIARKLAERHHVVGVDISEAMLRLARSAVPEARFVLGDILDVELDTGPFDAVVVMNVLFHLPSDQHARAIGRVWSWLRPGGYLLATLTEQAEASYTEDDFFGTEMYWSNLGWADYEEILRGIGFELVSERIVGPGYGRTPQTRDDRHPMTLVRKPVQLQCAA